MNDEEFIAMIKEMVLAPDTVMRKEWVIRLMEIIVKKDMLIRKYQEREKIRDKYFFSEPLQVKLAETETTKIPKGGVFVTPDMLKKERG